MFYLLSAKCSEHPFVVLTSGEQRVLTTGEWSRSEAAASGARVPGLAVPVSGAAQ